MNKRKNEYPTRWEEVTLKEYDDIVKIQADEYTPAELTVEIMKVFVPDVEDRPVTELPKIAEGLQFLQTPYKRKMPKKSYVIEGERYDVCLTERQMTVAQYIDAQTFAKNEDMKHLYLCFLVPHGKKYGEGYDFIELADRLYQTVTMDIVTDIGFFFEIRSKIYASLTLRYTERATMKMAKKAKDKQEREALIQQAGTIRAMREAMR